MKTNKDRAYEVFDKEQVKSVLAMLVETAENTTDAYKRILEENSWSKAKYIL